MPVGAAEPLHQALGAWTYDQAYNRIVATVRAQLDERTYAAAWAAGRALTLEQAIAYALDESAESEHLTGP